MRNIDEIGSVRTGEHFVQFYQDDNTLIDSIFAFLTMGFEKGETGIAIATRAHRNALEKKFTDEGYDLSELKRSGKFNPFDAAETLGLFMRNGMPDAHRFRALVGALMESAAKNRCGIRAYGEMVSVLWGEGNREAAIELEKLWNDLAKDYSFTLFCAYHEKQFSESTHGSLLDHVCCAHSRIIGHRPQLKRA